MRVVGGSARGRRLVAPGGSRTRPTADRVRESIMNMLWSRGAVDDVTVLDLFAGSGALGIEALSRGAAHATFVDDDPQARRAITENLEVCGVADRAEVVADRAERFVARAAAEGRQYDLVFCDPPYAYDGWGELFEALPADLVVVESGAEISPPAGWEIVRDRRYGAAWVGLVSKKPELEGSAE